MILGIESSCDDSALALFSAELGILEEWVHRQLLHAEYGGIVPALASREHLQNFTPMLSLLQKKLAGHRLSGIAVTCGPGLAGCLALGISLGKALALAYNVPLHGVNHLRAHAFSPFIPVHRENPGQFQARFTQELLPHLGLLVSGGNTLLFEINQVGLLKILAQTVDDAAGEALDKGAKLLGMPYPGGALIEKEAASGNPHYHDFPKAFPGPDQMRFSFSGLKTSMRYLLEKMTDEEVQKHKLDLCASYQNAVISALIKKTRQATASGAYESFGLSGGVANNKVLQQKFQDLAAEVGRPCLIAQPEHTTDNAAMVAFAAYADPRGLVDSPKPFSLTFSPALPLA